MPMRGILVAVACAAVMGAGAAHADKWDPCKDNPCQEHEKCKEKGGGWICVDPEAKAGASIWDLPDVRKTKGVAISGHVLSWLGMLPLTTGAIMAPRVLLDGSAGGCGDSCLPEEVFQAYLGIETIGMAFIATGVPLLMAAQYKIRKTLNLKCDAGARHLNRGAWAMFSLTELFIIGGLLPYGINSLILIPLAALTSLITVILAEVALHRVGRRVHSGESTAGFSSAAPWVAPIHGGLVMGIGGTF